MTLSHKEFFKVFPIRNYRMDNAHLYLDMNMTVHVEVTGA